MLIELLVITLCVVLAVYILLIHYAEQHDEWLSSGDLEYYKEVMKDD